MDMAQVMRVASTVTHYAICKDSPDGIVWYDYHYGIWSRYPVQMHTTNAHIADSVYLAHDGARMVTVETQGHASMVQD
jgi:hypothetical protein